MSDFICCLFLDDVLTIPGPLRHEKEEEGLEFHNPLHAELRHYPITLPHLKGLEIGHHPKVVRDLSLCISTYEIRKTQRNENQPKKVTRTSG